MNNLAIRVSIDFKSIQSDLAKIQKQINNTNITIGSKNIKTTNNELKATSDSAKNASKSFGILGQSAASAFLKFSTWFGISTLFVSLIHNIRNSISWVGQLDDSIHTMNMTFDGSKSTFDKMTDATTAFAKSLGSTIDNAIQATKIYTSMNETMEGILEKSTASIVLSNIGGMAVSITDASNSLSAFQNQFELTDDSLMSLADTISFVSSNLRMDFGSGIREISAGVKMAGSLFDEMGLSAEQSIAIMGKMIETSRRSGSSLAAGLRTSFSRIQRVSELGEEDISKLESAYKSIGIEIRKSETEFHTIQTIISSLSSKWDELTGVQRSWIAEMSAGVRQKSTFLNMMNVWSDSVDLYNESLNQSGFAMDRNSIYMDSYTGKLNLLKATWQEAVQNTLDSNDIKDSISGFTSLVGVFGKITSNVNLFGVALGTTYGIMAMYNRNLASNFIVNLSTFSQTWSRLNYQAMYTNGTFSNIPSTLTKVSNGFRALGLSINTTKIASIALNTAIGFGIGFLISKGIGLINDYAHAEENRKKAILDSARAIKESSNEIRNIEQLIEKKKELEKVEKSGKDIKAELVEVERQLAQAMPETITRYDEENKAISDNTKLVEENLEKKKEAMRIEAESIVAAAGGSIKDEKNELGELIKKREYYLKRAKEIESRIGTSLETNTEDLQLQAISENINELTDRINEQEEVVLNYDNALKTLNEGIKENISQEEIKAIVDAKSIPEIEERINKLKKLGLTQDDINNLIEKYKIAMNSSTDASDKDNSSKSKQISKTELLTKALNEQIKSQETSTQTMAQLYELYPQLAEQLDLNKDKVELYEESFRNMSENQIRLQQKLTEITIEETKERIIAISQELASLNKLSESAGFNIGIDFEKKYMRKQNSLDSEMKVLDDLLAKQEAYDSVLKDNSKSSKTSKEKIDLDKRYADNLIQLRDIIHDINILEEESNQLEGHGKIPILESINKLIPSQISALKELNQERQLEMSTLDKSSDRYQELKGRVQDTTLEMVRLDTQMKNNISTIQDIRKENEKLIKQQSEDLIEKYSKKLISSIENEKEHYEDLKDTIKETADAKISAIEEEIDRLEDRNDLLKDQEEREKRLNDIAKQKELINNLKDQREVQILQSNGEWTYVADPIELKKETDTLKELEKDYYSWERDLRYQSKIDKKRERIEEIKEELAEEQKKYDDKIAKLNKFSNDAKDVLVSNDDFQISSLKTLKESLSEIDSNMYSSRLSSLNSFVDSYNRLMAQTNSFVEYPDSVVAGVNTGGSSAKEYRKKEKKYAKDNDSEIREIAKRNNVDMGVASDMKKTNDKLGYEKYHDSGFVGGKPLDPKHEKLVLALKGEAFIAPKHLDQIYNNLFKMPQMNFPSTSAKPVETKQSFHISKLEFPNVYDGNGVVDALKQLPRLALQT